MDERTTWRDRAACRGTDPELFFPLSEEGSSWAQIWEAKQICHACPVQWSCLRWSLEHDATDGIWGGITASERRAMLTGRPVILARR
jgi:WhiB family transcriptional regulator, redox-sensing transcriptional regulator